VVNINTQTLPKDTDKQKPHNFHFASSPTSRIPMTTKTTISSRAGAADNFQDFFNRFLRRPGPRRTDEGDNGQVQESLGSGFIVDSKGYIITNDHVIDKADKIYVKLSTDLTRRIWDARHASSVWTKPRTWR